VRWHRSRPFVIIDCVSPEERFHGNLSDVERLLEIERIERARLTRTGAVWELTLTGCSASVPRRVQRFTCSTGATE
jgi:hypothetical protein